MVISSCGWIVGLEQRARRHVHRVHIGEAHFECFHRRLPAREGDEKIAIAAGGKPHHTPVAVDRQAILQTV